MEKFLKPEKLAVDPNSTTAAKEWNHWLRTFNNFLGLFTGDNAPNKLNVLVASVSHSVYDYIEDCTTYDDAIAILRAVYVKPKNEIFARHLLATRRQQSGESLDEFLQELRKLGKDCNFKQVSADVYKEELIRDSFINGISSNHIRQRLLENNTLDLTTAYNQATSLDLAQRQSDAYQPSPASGFVAAMRAEQESDDDLPTVAAIEKKKKSCFNCGSPTFHPRERAALLEIVHAILAGRPDTL